MQKIEANKKKNTLLLVLLLLVRRARGASSCVCCSDAAVRAYDEMNNNPTWNMPLAAVLLPWHTWKPVPFFSALLALAGPLLPSHHHRLLLGAGRRRCKKAFPQARRLLCSCSALRHAGGEG